MNMVLLENIYKKAEKIAFILLSILVVDLCVFGAGRLVELGPLTFRMGLLLLLFVFCIPLFLKNIKELFKSNYIRAIMVFAFLAVIATVIGVVNNNRMNLIVTDIKGFIYFAFLPCVLVLVNSYDRCIVLAKACMYSAAAQAMVHIIYICLYISNVPWLESVSQFCDERRFFYVSYKISPTNVRVSFLSAICLLLGVAFSIYFSTKAKTKLNKIVYPSITAICGFSLLASYTRSVFLAVAVTVFVLLVVLLIRLPKKEKMMILTHLLIMLVVFSVIIAGFKVVSGENYFTYALSRTFVGIDFLEDLFTNTGSSGSVDSGNEDSDDDSDKLDTFHQNTVDSDSIRAVTVGELVSNIKKSPIIGLGFGAEIPSRPDGLNEYFFLDLFSKMGIIGLISYLSPLGFMLVQLIQMFRRKHKQFLLALTWFSVLLGLVVYSYFTPCMNSSVGILVYCCVMAVFNFYNRSQLNLED
ncbi:MAG: hypothetical protein E7593_04985 [Ruminococcaceae bacterium]|nr:hypothetical protein [Oscillospiraceae bacterium]